MKTFIKRQSLQIKQGGWVVLFRKSELPLPILLLLPLCIFAIPILFILRMIRPWFLVRMHGLVSSTLGHFAGNTELYLCEQETGINVPKQRYVDLAYMAYKPICNQQLAAMWKRVLPHIWPAWILLPISRVNRLLPGGLVHEIGNNTQQDRDVHNLYERMPPHLEFTEKEEHKKNVELEKMGISKDVKIVLLHARDSSYKMMMYPDGYCKYHNYRDSDINNFIYAAELLAERGYYVIRMGAKVEKALKIKNPRIIDYASLYRSEFMDILLGAKCHFYLGDPCGIHAIPSIFRRPLALTNSVPLAYASSWGTNDLFISKKHWLEKEKRFMTFSEIYNSGAGIFYEAQKFEQAGITLIENTPEEIADLAIEMEERLKGAWQLHEDDEELQQRFWEIFPTKAVKAVGPNKGRPLHGNIRARVGAHFLRNNRDWLQ